MIHKNKNYKIHQDERVIAKRSRLAKFIGHFYPIKGKLRKHNMSCTCGMCDVNHPNGVQKRQMGLKEKNAIMTADEEIQMNAFRIPEPPEGMIYTNNYVISNQILDAMANKTNGYCPCVPQYLHVNNDYKCPCKECRETKNCRCKLFIKVI